MQTKNKTTWFRNHSTIKKDQFIIILNRKIIYFTTEQTLNTYKQCTDVLINQMNTQQLR